MDLNADGHHDILSGSYSRTDEQPMAGLFQVLRGRSDGTFEKAAVLNGTDGKPLIIPSKGQDDVVESICTRPFAADWDSDGDLDLIVGNFAGKFYLFAGEGAGKFRPTAEWVQAGDKPLSLKGEHAAHGDPFVVDWDKDGDLDVLSGSAEGGVQWAENAAGAKKPPSLKPFAQLIPPPPAEQRSECRPHEVTQPAGSTRVWVADVTGDGKLDLLVGDCINLISPADGVSEAEFKERYAKWKDDMAAAQKETQGLTDPEKVTAIQERMSKLHEQRKEFIKDDRTGFVWLYARK